MPRAYARGEQAGVYIQIKSEDAVVENAMVYDRDLYITVPHNGMVTCNLEIDGLNED